MKRILSVLLCLALALTLFAGCQGAKRSAETGPATEAPATEPPTTEAFATEPSPTAEEVWAAASARLLKISSLGLDLNIELGMTVLSGETVQLGQTTNPAETGETDETAEPTGAPEPEETAETVSMVLNLPGKLTLSPLVFHSAGTVKAVLTEADSEPVEDEGFVEFFLALEDGKLAFYFRDESDGEFSRIELDLPEQETSGTSLWAAQFQWDMETGEDSYLLTHTVTAEESAAYWEQATAEGDQALDLLKRYGISTDSFRELYAGLELRMTVDRESLEYRELSVDASGPIQTVLNEIVGQIMGSLDGEDYSEMFRDLRCVVTAKLHDYDGVGPIELPEEYDDFGNPFESVVPDHEYYQGSLDEGWSVEGFSFRPSEVTPRDFLENGWVVTDRFGVSDVDDGMLDPGSIACLYLVPANRESGDGNPLRLFVSNIGEETADCLDCRVYILAVNDVLVDAGVREGLADFTGPCGIERGMSRIDVIAVLGEPYQIDFEINNDSVTPLVYFTEKNENLILLFDGDDSLEALYYQDFKVPQNGYLVIPR